MTRSSTGSASAVQYADAVAPGIYLHVPFCAAVCPYCDFAVLVGDADRRERFVQTLIAEINLHSRAPFPPDTVYFGGGTPSMLEPEQLARVLDALASRFELAADTRIFLEANPEDVTVERLRAWSELGVRTLSLGVQSFDPDRLGFLGRAHTPAEGRLAVELALDAGFDTVSLDLIYGLPGQGVASWQSDLEAAVALGPDHLSCYQLTVHSKTDFGVRKRRGELVELPDDDQAELFELTHRRLHDAGYPGYEVSNFARSPEHRSRHNMKYWDHTPYLGLGPSAHSYAGGRRWWNHRALGSWRRAVAAGERPVAGSEKLSDRELALERLMLGMRTYEGLDGEALRSDYGVDLTADSDALERLIGGGFVEREGARIRPTLRGLAIADSIARELAPRATALGPPGSGASRAGDPEASSP